MANYDLTTFSLVGADSAMATVGASTLAIVGAEADETAALYKDMGVSGITGDFTFRFVFNASKAQATTRCELIGVTNTVAYAGLGARAGFSLELAAKGSSTSTLDLVKGTGTDSSSVITLSTDYYITVSRSGSTLTCTVRTGSHVGTVFDTMVRTVSGSYRYLYFFSTFFDISGGPEIDYAGSDYDDGTSTSDISATLAATLDAVTLTSTVETGHAGVLTQTLDDITLSSSGELEVQGTTNETLDDITLSSSGASLERTGEVDSTLADISLVGFGGNIADGTLAATLDDIFSQSTAVEGGPTIVLLNKTLDDITLEGIGTDQVVVIGETDTILGDITLLGVGTQADVIAYNNSTLDDFTLDAHGIPQRAIHRDLFDESRSRFRDLFSS